MEHEINIKDRKTSPFIVTNNTTQKVMLYVIIAMVPIVIASVMIFGVRAFVVTIVSVTACVLFEFLFNLLFKKPQTIDDLSAVVTGMLFAFTLPVTVPLYVVFVGAFIAIIIVKMLFGGLGHNFANPAVAARIFVMMSFSTDLSTWINPEKYKNMGIIVSEATPLSQNSLGVLDLFLGNYGGSLGETSKLAIIIGGIFLIVTQIIKPYTPTAYIITMALFGLALGHNPIEYVLMGGVFLGAFFMATDYSSSPYTPWGKIIFGVGCAILNVIIRESGGYPEGTALSILMMNLATPWIETWTRPEQFGSNTPYKSRKISIIIFLFCVFLSFVLLFISGKIL